MKFEREARVALALMGEHGTVAGRVDLEVEGGNRRDEHTRVPVQMNLRRSRLRGLPARW